MEPLPCLRDVELIHLSRDIPHTSYSELCDAIGYPYHWNQSILVKHQGNYTEAMTEIVTNWNTDQAETSQSRSNLARKLHDVKLGGLGKKLSKGEYLPKKQDPHEQEATPLQSSSGMVEEKARKVPSFPMDYRSKTIRGSPYRDRGAEEPHTYPPTSFPTTTTSLPTMLPMPSLPTISLLPMPMLPIMNEELERRYTDPARFAEDIVLQNQGFLPELKRRDSSSAPFCAMENSRHDLFDSPMRRLIVYSNNAAERTALCHSLSYDWATQNRTSALSEKQHLFELSANDIKPNQTIENAIKDQLFPDLDKVDEALIRQLLKDMPHGITILLDGFNEKNYGDNIMDVLLGHTHQKVTVMVTTQPRCANMLHGMAPGRYDRIDMH